jgi:hypothetical protein
MTDRGVIAAECRSQWLRRELALSHSECQRMQLLECVNTD